jgi:hypothetical protein
VNLKDFETNRKKYFFGSASKEITSIDEFSRRKYIDYIGRILLRNSENQTIEAPGWHDRGLIFKSSETNTYVPLSRPAKKALLEIWIDISKIIPILSTDNGSEQGRLFEEGLINALIKRLPSQIEIITKDGKPGFVPLSENSALDLVSFDLKTMPASSRDQVTLFRPRSQSFGAWDFILSIPEIDGISSSMVFFSVSMNLPSKHETEKKIRDSFSKIQKNNIAFKEVNQRSQVEQILDANAGQKGLHKAEITKQGHFQVTRNGQKINNVHFLMACGQPAAELKVDIMHKLKLSGLRVFGRETCEKFGVVF